MSSFARWIGFFYFKISNQSAARMRSAYIADDYICVVPGITIQRSSTLDWSALTTHRIFTPRTCLPCLQNTQFWAVLYIYRWCHIKCGLRDINCGIALRCAIMIWGLPWLGRLLASVLFADTTAAAWASQTITNDAATIRPMDTSLCIVLQIWFIETIYIYLYFCWRYI